MIFGDGLQTRDYLFIDDVVEALARAAIAKGIDGAIINIGRGQETTVNELVDQVEKATGRHVNVIRNAEKGGGVSRLAADISRAGKLLDFRPQIDLAAGLRLTIERDPRFSPRQA